MRPIITNDPTVRARSEREAARLLDAIRRHRGMMSDHTEGAVCEAVFDLECERIEAEARRIYDTWAPQPGWVPWTPGGNSDQQDRARREALAAWERTR